MISQPTKIQRRTACCFIAALSLALAAPPSAFSQVTPDGGTATRATQAASGQVTVGIAASNASGISHNTYSEFSVTRAGVNLDNGSVRASTIVNEVTSAKRSLLGGPIEVLGSRAHVVIANPNGMTVDGASFVNTGGVVLSGGPVRFGVSATTGLTNTILESGNGDILVTGEGLTGSMTTLHLLAARLKIDGPVTNLHVSPNADISLSAGRSELELDSSVSPISTTRTLASRRDIGSASNDVLVDITPNGSLTASRVSIAVNSRGAGVSFAGSGLANVGDFTISANGKVTVRGADIRSEGALKIAGTEIEILNAERQASLTSNTKSVSLLASAGDITIFGRITGVERDASDAQSRGAVTLEASGNISIFTERADRLALVFASKDDLWVQTGGNLSNDSGRLLSNAKTILRIGGELANLTPVVGAHERAETVVTGRRQKRILGSWFGLKRRSTVMWADWGNLRVRSQLAFIVGQSIDVQAGRIINTGEIDALDGTLSIRTSSLVNSGVKTGAYRYVKECGITCWSKGHSTESVVGGKINATGTASIVATDIVDNAGEIISYGDMIVSAPTVTARALFTVGIANRTAGFYNMFAGSQAVYAMVPNGGLFITSGELSVLSDHPIAIDGGRVEGVVSTLIPNGTIRARENKAYFPRKQHIGVSEPLLP